MSGTTAPNRRKLHHVVLHHARKPYGMFIIGAGVFALAWWSWVLLQAGRLPG